MGTEFEATLLIISYQPDIMMEMLSKIEHIGQFEILPKRSFTIHDCYFDTKDRSLMKQGTALRIRKIGREHMLCLKGCERVNEWGGIERLEIEERWSIEALEKILGAQCQIPFDMGNIVFEKTAPGKTLERLGLQCIQNRLTGRTVRDIIEPVGETQILCAEMALDKVRYRFGKSEFNHFEMEIEAKTHDSEDHIRTIVTLLKNMFPVELRQWNHNKLITGFAIESLLQKGDLAVSSQKNTATDKTGYEKIETYINNLKS